ncbi:hypothetical protein TWF481_005938 [Arthrobotrys musiformis]|uniref:Uncharacterized protein n=1 Tax=Arthrobotrys musiformis TaxID=47236 RepID=A0AAV9WL00_9PEZI
MVSFKTLSIFLSAGIFGLQALAGPIPNSNQEVSQITTLKESHHAEQASLLDSLNGFLRKRLAAFIVEPESPLFDESRQWGISDDKIELSGDGLSARSISLAPREVTQTIEVQTVTFSEEEKEILRQSLTAGFPAFDAVGLNTISPPGFLVALLIIGSVGGALFMIFPVGWLF